MVALVKKHWPLVQFLCKTRSIRSVKCVLEHLNKSQLQLLSEIALNVLLGNIPISKHYKKKLKPSKDKLISWAEKRQTPKAFASNVSLLQDLLRAAFKILQTL